MTTIMYALNDTHDGHLIPSAGNPLAPSQKAVYGTKEDAEKIAKYSNDYAETERFVVVPVEVFPLVTIASAAELLADKLLDR